MANVNSYRDLIVWQHAMDICVQIYETTGSFPNAETYGLTNQIRRCSISIPSNIAEGHARPTRDYARFLNIARGSLNELCTQIEIAYRIGYISEDKFGALMYDLNMLGRQLNALIRKIRG
ncbi:MAG: four helix bundle protein [Anaerolineales bacterium]|nr:four helix bundle protein [Anaerolineales bacterium]